MSLTRAEALAAAERADVYPKGEGRVFIAGNPPGTLMGGGLPGPAVVVRDMRGTFEIPFIETWQAQDDLAEAAGLSNHEYCCILNEDPPAIAAKLRAYAASLPAEAGEGGPL